MGDCQSRSGSPSRILLLAQQRTGSTLLCKMLGLEHQPDVHFDPLAKTCRDVALLTEQLGLGQKQFGNWTDSEKSRVMESFRVCVDSLLFASATAESQNKIFFHKDHAGWIWRPDAKAPGDHGVFHGIAPDSYDQQLPPASQVTSTNPTVLPVDFLASSRLIFCVRHPALAFASACRGSLELQLLDPGNWKGELMRSLLTYSYTRVLYDWNMALIRENGSHDRLMDPIIVSGSDIVHNPGLVPQLAKELGLDPSKVQTTWNTTSFPEDTLIMREIFCRVANQSTGVIKEKAPEKIDIEEEKRKWVAEFGCDLAGIISDCVEHAIPDYEYLMSKRFQGVGMK
ncbi:uncharacterized protein KD926_000611 [Aspergillus affinis]|uniref:uncharacterized protein n=1 Tax=Aspergillus affinis TaxID=1070780 RepID=UPI0022FF3D88|nr:uncharacterized protein KD926_000611 [Aspergillus affinis]KAI9037324.1 hypothetical protein KD926_000611 [Aspergillus affinis]